MRRIIALGALLIGFVGCGEDEDAVAGAVACETEGETKDCACDGGVGLCVQVCQGQEWSQCSTEEETTAEHCSDFLDNDGDGRIDCDDPGCMCVAEVDAGL